MSQHTPGPWTFSKGAWEKFGRPQIADARGYYIAEITPQGQETEANARLIAKVPEMYEMIYWIANGDTRKSCAAMLAELRNRARALLREVEG